MPEVRLTKEDFERRTIFFQIGDRVNWHEGAIFMDEWWGNGTFTVVEVREVSERDTKNVGHSQQVILQKEDGTILTHKMMQVKLWVSGKLIMKKPDLS